MESSPQEPLADENLLNLLPAQFQPLSEAEKKLLVSAPAAPPNNRAVCGPNGDDNDPANHPSKADAKWGRERVIRAGLIRWLCVDGDVKDRVDPFGINVFAAKITGPLDL